MMLQELRIFRLTPLSNFLAPGACIVPPANISPESALAHRLWLVDPLRPVVVVSVDTIVDQGARRWVLAPCLVELALKLHGSSLSDQADHQAGCHLMVEIRTDEDELHSFVGFDHTGDVVRENSASNHLVDGSDPLGNRGLRHHCDQQVILDKGSYASNVENFSTNLNLCHQITFR